MFQAGQVTSRVFCLASLSFLEAKELASLFPVIHDLPDEVIIICPYANGKPIFWGFIERKKGEEVGECAYGSGLNHILTRIKSGMSECPLPQRYGYNWGTASTASIKRSPSHKSHLKLVDDDDDDWPELISG